MTCPLCGDSTLKETIIDLLKDVTSSHKDKESSDYNECDTDPCQWCEDADYVIAKLNGRLG